MGLFKKLGSSVGDITGKTISTAFSLAGALTGNDTLDEIGEAIHRTSKSAGEAIGNIAEGTINVVISAASGDYEKANEQGKEALSDTMNNVKEIGAGVVDQTKATVNLLKDTVEGKELGSKLGHTAGKVLGAGFKAAGSCIDSDYLSDVGESIHRATCHTGEIIDSVVDGTIQIADGALNNSSERKHEGIGKIGETASNTASGIAHGIVGLSKTGYEGVKSAVNGDAKGVKESLKTLGKVALVSTFAIGVCDLVDGLDGVDAVYADTVFDIDGDGILDSADIDGDGIIDYTDINSDGITDFIDKDLDGDGVIETRETENYRMNYTRGYFRTNPDGSKTYVKGYFKANPNFRAHIDNATEIKEDILQSFSSLKQE